MQVYTKKLNYYLVGFFSLVSFIFLINPIIASANTEKILKTCWTKAQCLETAAPVGDCTDFNDKTNYCFEPDEKFCGSANMGKCYVKPKPIDLKVAIPNIDGSASYTKVKSFPEYLKILYSYFVYIIAFLAVAYLGWGGFQWMMAAGSAEKISIAKETIQGALIGLLLASGSYVLLSTINSRLVNIEELKVERIKPTRLASLCTDSTIVNVNDLVLASNPNGPTETAFNTKCGQMYISKSNPAQACYGRACDNNEWCVPDSNQTFECVSLSTAKTMCNKESAQENPGSCIDVDKYYENAKIPLTCKIYFSGFNYNLIQNPNATVYTKIGGWLYNLVVGDSSDSMKCEAFDLFNKFDYYSPNDGGTYYIERFDCEAGAPLCYGGGKSKMGCVNESSVPRIGIGYDRMCVYMTQSPVNNRATICAPADQQPECNCDSESVCQNLNLSACQYQTSQQKTCLGTTCEGNNVCWYFVGLSK